MRVAHRLRRHWALVAVCALFTLAGALLLDDYGIMWVDAQGQREVGNVALDYLAGDGERAFEQLSSPVDRNYGTAFDVPLVLLERILGLESVWEARVGEGVWDVTILRHLASHLFFVAGGVFCYVLVLRLFNNRLLALVAMVLFLLHPRIYAHSFFNTKDVPFLAMFMVSLYLMHRAFRRGTLGAFLLCGVGVGLLINLRVMGIILFAAVLALRALDLPFVTRAERGRVLLTGGAFALAAALTFHASMPILWTDPAGRFAELVRSASSHPFAAFNYFQGDWLFAPDGPPFDYLPVWVGITTPPVVLLLALIGAFALAWRGIPRPRDILRAGRLRFGFLLLALPIATAIAVVALESNVYHDWRHLYFLYAPLLLLAVFGLRQFVLAQRGRWVRAGAYVLAGAGVAVAVVAMVRIHPLETNYFTVLADRAAPERLLLRYDLLYWEHAVGDVLTDILEDHPSEHLFLDSGHPRRRVLPSRDDRQRFTLTADFRSGERNFSQVRDLRACSGAGAYVRRLHASTLYCVVDPVAYFGTIRRAARASEPLARSTFDIHRDGRTLTYLRDGCPAEDITARFLLHVYPADPADLPEIRRAHGFDNLDFFAQSDTLGNSGEIGVPRLSTGAARIDGNCVAATLLPDYPIARIRIGQFTDDGVRWQVDIAFDNRGMPVEPPDYADARREALAGAPLASGVFDVHGDGRALIYVRDGCSVEDAATQFFLHVEPVDMADLSAYRREHGFDNLDFSLATHGARIDGNCVAVVPLPDYPIARIRTGQFTDDGTRWEVEAAFDGRGALLAPPDYADARREALASEPLARSVFDVYLVGRTLTYLRDDCAKEDATSRFFLHVDPVDVDDLPERRREYGFEALDFTLATGGARTGGNCVAVARLPAYGVASVRTGQYDETGQLWAVEFTLPE